MKRLPAPRGIRHAAPRVTPATTGGVKHKYVRHSELGFILWPYSDDLYHSHVGELMDTWLRGHIVSAGFAYIGPDSIVCNGESESLSIKSRADDSAALSKQLGRTP